MGIARAYASDVGAGAEHLEQGKSEPITSFVPERPGMYRKYMKLGDDHFREEKYHSASRYFKMANNIAGRDPESLLSLAHSSFAVSRGSYARASYYLRKALEYFPELPLVNLQPREFYGNPTTYIDHIFRLENYVRDNPQDGEALLLLAYFRWFNERHKDAAELLKQARSVTKSPELLEAISIFWDGMVASGQVSGQLEPATRPAENRDRGDEGAAETLDKVDESDSGAMRDRE